MSVPDTFSRVTRRVALIAIVVGAAGSVGLMLDAARTQQSYLLTALFTVWVLGPFVALICAFVASKGWTALIQRIFHGVAVSVTAGSLGIYGSLAFGALRAKNGFIYLVVPAGTWLLIAIAFALARLKSR